MAKIQGIVKLIRTKRNYRGRNNNVWILKKQYYFNRDDRDRIIEEFLNKPSKREPTHIQILPYVNEDKSA